MIHFLIIYGTGEGQTEKVATRIVETLEARGHEATGMKVDNRPADFDLGNYDAVLVGASIHVGKHQGPVKKFVADEAEALAAVPTAFFQVSLSSATEEGQEQAATYVTEFLDETGWNPDRIGKFGGALRFSKYGFLKRLFMRQIAKRTMPEVKEAKGDVEFTDWEEVDAFAADVAAFVEGRVGVVPPQADGGE